MKQKNVKIPGVTHKYNPSGYKLAGRTDSISGDFARRERVSEWQGKKARQSQHNEVEQKTQEDSGIRPQATIKVI